MATEIARWKVGKAIEVRFVIQSIRESGGNRLVERERAYRDGAKIDDTGSKAKTWTLDTIWENSIEELGLEGNTKDLYPDMLNEMIASFDEHETGDLTIPTRGRVRARAESYDRTESTDMQDGARVSFTFKLDNEDKVGAASFKNPTASSDGRRISEETTFDAEESGVWDGSLAELNGLVSELEGIANLPENAAQDIATTARIIRTDVKRVRAAHEKATDDASGFLLDPANSGIVRRLTEAADLAGRSEGEAVKALPQTIAFEVERDSSLSEIAAQLGQDFDDLLELNQYRIPDPSLIEAGTIIRVFE